MVKIDYFFEDVNIDLLNSQYSQLIFCGISIFIIDKNLFSCKINEIKTIVIIIFNINKSKS